MNPSIIDAFTHHLAVALFNGVYQGLLILLVVWLGFKVFHRINAATRHAVNFAALLLVFALPLIHIVSPTNPFSTPTPLPTTLVDVGTAPPIPRTTARPILATPSARLTPESNPISFSNSRTTSDPANATSGIHTPESFNTSSFQYTASVSPFLDPIGPDPAPIVADPSVQRFTSTPLSATHLVTSESTRGADPKPSDTASSTKAPAQNLTTPIVLPRLDLPLFKPSGTATLTILQGILLLLAIISAIRLVRLSAQSFALSRLKRTSQPASPMALKIFDHIRTSTDIRRPVRLRISDQLSTPMAVGYFNPVILLPSQHIQPMTESALEAILRHELAHMSRHDDWTNLIQQIVAALFFFHPAIRWLDHRLTIDREIACDDHALAAGSTPADYALLLTDFVRHTRHDSDWIAAPAGWNGSSQLKERIDMILDTKRNSAPRLAPARAGILTFAIATAAALVLLTAPRLVLAAPNDPTPPPPQPTAPITAGAPRLDPSDTAVLQAPTPVAAPVPVAPPMPPEVMRRYFGKPDAPHHPVPPPPVPPQQPIHGDLEARLDRLEAMVRSLVESRVQNQEQRLHSPPAPGNPFDQGPHPTPHPPRSDLPMEIDTEIEMDDSPGLSSPPRSRTLRNVESYLPDKRDIDNAVRAAEQQAQKALEFLHRSTGDLGRQLSERHRQRESTGSPRESHLRRQLLHEHRGNIERQKRALERQMQNLDREMQRLGAQLEELNASIDEMEQIEQEERLEQLKQRKHTDGSSDPLQPR